MVQNLLKDLESLLLEDARFVSDGKILKNALIEAALKPDAGLVKALIKNEPIRKHFFLDIDGTLIFDKVKFQDFVSNRDFLPSSYTAFRNKIGLVDKNRKPLVDSKDVVLAWAYKDCVLEGGMTKDDIARDEIFYNTTLAPDEITRLFDPKVLTKFEYWDQAAVKANKPKPVKDLGQSENLLIKGNNLLALHSLKKKYAGKVKLIYIDPPYNTGGDSFRYNDSFNHSSWLTFMKNRLEISRQLLTDDGSIWVNIDDHEAHYLKIVMDEVFGRENFFGNVIWQHSVQGKNDAKTFSLHHNHILVFQKSSLFQRNTVERTDEHNINYSNPDNDPKGAWRSGDVRSPNLRENLRFIVKTPTGKEIEPPENGWRWSEELFYKKIKTGEITFINNETKVLRKIYLSDQEGRVPETIWFGKDVGTSREGNGEIKKLFDSKVFETPKPERLLQRIINIASEEGDLVLDFFSGSGTTPSVAHKINRSWIAIEQMDYIKDLPEARIKKVIDGEQGGISEDVNWQGGGNFIYVEIMEWNGRYIQDIRKAKTTKDLLKLYDEMKRAAFFRYDVNLSAYQEKDFEALDFKDQQKALIDCLEMNHLYVNYSEIDDKTYAVSEEDRLLNRQFYNGNTKDSVS